MTSLEKYPECWVRTEAVRHVLAAAAVDEIRLRLEAVEAGRRAGMETAFTVTRCSRQGGIGNLDLLVSERWSSSRCRSHIPVLPWADPLAPWPMRFGKAFETRPIRQPITNRRANPKGRPEGGWWRGPRWPRRISPDSPVDVKRKLEAGGAWARIVKPFLAAV